MQSAGPMPETDSRQQRRIVAQLANVPAPSLVDIHKISSVLFILTSMPDGSTGLILNKRSSHVSQPGDLCCPGGRISPRLDRVLAQLLRLPNSPLHRWQKQRRRFAPPHVSVKGLDLLLAAGLREGAEEMRLLPWSLDFLGPMPAMSLVMFQRAICPLVCWLPRQQRFRTNWEVSRIVTVALDRLMQSRHHYRLCLEMPTDAGRPRLREFGCVHIFDGSHHELLWGVTYRITMWFLTHVFGFSPPRLDDLPMIQGTMGLGYLSGRSGIQREPIRYRF